MIISHKYQYIFIKTKKTAGTSIELALAKFCGPDDVITPLTPEDEVERQRLGYRGPQNHYIPFSGYTRADWSKFFSKRRRVRFRNHTSAEYIREHIARDVWDSYFKFCFERNPWDKVISWYFWKNQTEPRPSISEYIASGKANNIKGFEAYTVNGDIVVDEVYLYENLPQAMAEIAGKLGLPEVPELPHAKSGTRRDKRSYREVLGPADVDKIRKVYAREIAYFGYD